jgi:predicted DCC family thiol-disulfide oxidoreductase YuxK
VLYDGVCPFCIGLADRFGPMLRRRGFELAPLQTPWVQARLNLKPDEPLTEMKLLTPDGVVLGGVEAMLYIADRFWWARPMTLVMRLPGIRHLLNKLYAFIAARRYCLGGACRLSDRRPLSEDKEV